MNQNKDQAYKGASQQVLYYAHYYFLISTKDAKFKQKLRVINNLQHYTYLNCLQTISSECFVVNNCLDKLRLYDITMN